MEVNYLAIIVGAVLSMVVGAIWYGPLFGKIWMEIIGVNPKDKKAMKEMQKSAGPLYAVQFALTLFQVFVLANIVADGSYNGIEKSVWIWAAFIIPTLAGSVMWTEKSTDLKWRQLFIQGGYQFVMFVIFGTLLQVWK